MLELDFDSAPPYANTVLPFIVHDVEQGSAEWHALRAGMPTGSEFPKLVTSTGKPSSSLEEYARILAAEIYAGKPMEVFDGNKWTERGKMLEAEARATYALDYNHEVTQVGFITDPDVRFGVSPDSLVDDVGLAEIKCLKTDKHIEALLYYRQHKRCLPKYVPQTQGQIMVTKREWCDLIFYHPDLPMVVVRQYPDEKVMSALAEQLDAVLARRDEIVEILKAA